MASPFGGEVTADGRVHGRGACDTKATLANLCALLGAPGRARRLRANLIVAGTVGEETGQLGARGFRSFLARRGIVLDELIVAEPTLCHPIYAHTGHVRLRFDLTGRAAHSSVPGEGANALVAAAALITGLVAEHEAMQKAALPTTGVGSEDDHHDRDGGRGDDGSGGGGGGVGSSPLGRPTLTPTLASGGSGINIVPGHASVSVDRRVVAGEVAANVASGLEAKARQLMGQCTHCVSLGVQGATSSPVQDAFVQERSSPLVTRLEALTGRQAEVATYGTNAGLPYDARMSRATVVFGPGSIAQAHQADEWVSLHELALHQLALEGWLFSPDSGSGGSQVAVAAHAASGSQVATVVTDVPPRRQAAAAAAPACVACSEDDTQPPTPPPQPQHHQPQRILVFGAAGQTGRALLSRLAAAGHVAVAFERSPAAWAAWADIYGAPPSNVEHVYDDITDYAAVAAAAQTCDGIVHAAVYFPPSLQVKLPDYSASVGPQSADSTGGGNTVADTADGRVWNVNLQGLYNVLEAARTTPSVRRVVHIGSAHAAHPKGVFFDAATRRSDGERPDPPVHAVCTRCGAALRPADFARPPWPPSTAHSATRTRACRWPLPMLQTAARGDVPRVP